MGVKLYPDVQYKLEEDLTPDLHSGKNIESLCSEIHQACKGWGTDEDRLLKAMGSQTPVMRCKVPFRYKVRDQHCKVYFMLQIVRRESFACPLRYLIVYVSTPDLSKIVESSIFQVMFDQELKDVMKSECGSRDFGTALQFLAVPPLEAECMMIKHACGGVGTDEKVLASIVCGRTNKELNMLKVRPRTCLVVDSKSFN